MPLYRNFWVNKMHQITLSASDLLVMSESDYMNSLQLSFFRQLLEEQRQQIFANAEDSLMHFRQAETESDVSDRATQEEQSTLERRFRDRERKLLLKIEAALQRIQEKTYGYCDESGEPIGLLRLLARPTATLCIEEQEKHEKIQRNFQG